MPRNRQRDPVEEARKQAASQLQQQRQAQTSAYAAARFNEWAQGAQDREALMNARLQNQQSEAELKGAQLNYNMWKDNELRRQTTAYYTAMPVLQEQLKNNGIFPGSPRYAAEMSAFAAEIPDAVTHNEAIRKELMDFSKTDATAAEITDKAKILQEGLAGAGLHGTSFSSTAAGNFDVKATRPNEVQIPNQVLMRYGKLTGDITEYADSDKPRVAAAQKEKSIFEAKYPGLSNLVPPETTPTPTPAGSNLNPLQKGLIAIGLGKAPPQATPAPTATTSPTPATANQIPSITSQDEYNSLPAGSQFNFNGKIGMKPQEPANTGQ